MTRSCTGADALDCLRAVTRPTVSVRDIMAIVNNEGQWPVLDTRTRMKDTLYRQSLI